MNSLFTREDSYNDNDKYEFLKVISERTHEYDSSPEVKTPSRSPKNIKTNILQISSQDDLLLANDRSFQDFTKLKMNLEKLLHNLITSPSVGFDDYR